MRCLLMLCCLGALLPGRALAQEQLDTLALLQHVKVLSADSLEGRRTGTAGSRRARAYLARAFAACGLHAFGDSYEVPFSLPRAGRGAEGVNLLGYLKGTEHPGSFIVVTAHYDHEGIRRGAVYNGADDNASGVAGLLAAADYFRRNPPKHSILFAALDAEEQGLFGARALVRQPPVPRERLLLNINLDMISRSERGELYAAGTYHYPFLKPVLERVARQSRVHLRFGHDRPELGPHDDWTDASDHGPFHEAGIPFIYFGVEDHEDYHLPTDDFARIHQAFFIRAVDTIITAVAALDAEAELLHRRPPAGAR